MIHPSEGDEAVRAADIARVTASEEVVGTHDHPELGSGSAHFSADIAHDRVHTFTACST